MTALGVLVAIAVSILFLALAGAHRTTTTIAVTASQAASGSGPQIYYLGPRQVRAGGKPPAAQAHGDATAPAAGGSNRAPQYTCVPEKFCVRVR
jgi:hypothetical protein